MAGSVKTTLSQGAAASMHVMLRAGGHRSVFAVCVVFLSIIAGGLALPLESGAKITAQEALPECGTVSKPLQSFPLGLRQIPDDKSFASCDCSDSLLSGLHENLNHTAAVHQRPPFDLIYKHKEGDTVMGCEWAWKCKHSVSRFPPVYHEAEPVIPAARRQLEECGPVGSNGKCQAVQAHEMVLREVTEDTADENGVQEKYWGFRLEKRTVGYVCVIKEAEPTEATTSTALE